MWGHMGSLMHKTKTAIGEKASAAGGAIAEKFSQVKSGFNALVERKNQTGVSPHDMWDRSMLVTSTCIEALPFIRKHEQFQQCLSKIYLSIPYLWTPRSHMAEMGDVASSCTTFALSMPSELSVGSYIDKESFAKVNACMAASSAYAAGIKAMFVVASAEPSATPAEHTAPQAEVSVAADAQQ
jgi:hypothetical protein